MAQTSSRIRLCHPSYQCLVMIILCCLVMSSSAVSALSAPALLVFGDSIVDPGNNNNRLLSLAKCNYPPYGRDFEGGRPTGRFSNGKIPTDFMAKGLGIKELLPAYLDPEIGIDDLLTGVSFASGGAGYDPLTSGIETALPLPAQLRMFEDYTEKLEAAVGKERTSAIISNSIYVVCAGSNDISNSYFLTGLRRSQFSIDSYTNFLIDHAAQFFQNLYDLGARRIVITGVPPLGCLPSQRTLAGGFRRHCAEEIDYASREYNRKLQIAIQSLLKEQLPGAKLQYFDLYNPLLDLIQHPHRSGFTVVDKGCCGTGTIEVEYLCILGLLDSCEDTNKYVFWDSFHPTERAYKLVVNQLLNSTNLIV